MAKDVVVNAKELLDAIRGANEKKEREWDLPEAREEYEAYMNERVGVMLIKDSDRYKDDVTVTLNGVNYQIKRGAEVLVPRKVKELLDDCASQRLLADKIMDKMKE